MFEDLEKQLDQAFTKLKSEMSGLKQKYTDDLSSMEIGYKHKLDEIVWMEYFIKFQMDKIQPGEYIDKYFTHMGMQEDFLRNLVIPDNKDVNVDTH